MNKIFPYFGASKGQPTAVDALCIMTSLLAGLWCQGKAPQSAQPEKAEVPTTCEPFSCSVRVLAAVTDCDRTNEAMVDDIPPFFFPFPNWHERGAMNLSVMALRDPQEDVLPSSLAPTGAS